MNCLGLFMTFILNCLPRKDQSIGDIFRYALHSFLLSCVVIIATQQMTLTMDVYHQSVQERIDAATLYEQEQCNMGNIRGRARIQDCSEWNITLQTTPFVRTLIKVSRGWNSCVYMPCSDLFIVICSNIQYKIAFLLIAMALISYSVKLFRCGKKKSQDYIFKRKLEKVNKLHLMELQKSITDYLPQGPLQRQEPL